MIRNIKYTKRFQKDLKRMIKRNKDMKIIKNVISKLLQKIPLEAKYKNHKLIGNYKNRYECHIESNWLLIYKYEENEIILERTGTHNDLFD